MAGDREADESRYGPLDKAEDTTPLRPTLRQEATGLDSVAARREWCAQEADHMREQGVVWLRVTHNPDDVGHLILEGWDRRPQDEEIPDPPWGEPFTSHELVANEPMESRGRAK